MKKSDTKYIQFQVLQRDINIFLQKLPAKQLKKVNKFIYDPQNILNEFSNLIQPLLIYAIAVKLPLVIQIQDQDTLKRYDKQIKKLYQSFICQRKLLTQFEFQFFVLIVVKCGRQFMEQEFEYIEFCKQDQRQLYCIIIKILLGLNVHQKAYSIIEKKFIDQEKSQYCPMIQPMKRQVRQSQCKNNSKSSKRLISLNCIQAKMERKKQNRYKKCERISINTWRNSQQIEQFKENLMKQLKVVNQTERKLEKIKYESLEKNNIHSLQNQKNIKQLMKNNYSKRKIIHTQQISSSLQLSLMMMKQCNHSYTKRNVPIRLTDSTPRFSHQVYEVSPTQRMTQPRENITKPKPQQKIARLTKKTKTYWNKMTSKMRQLNNSFQY